ncbi:hypothetical protein LINGRAHAP2_LOCUS25795 [Linum grandiflorum]
MQPKILFLSSPGWTPCKPQKAPDAQRVPRRKIFKVSRQGQTPQMLCVWACVFYGPGPWRPHEEASSCIHHHHHIWRWWWWWWQCEQQWIWKEFGESASGDEEI